MGLDAYFYKARNYNAAKRMSDKELFDELEGIRSDEILKTRLKQILLYANEHGRPFEDILNGVLSGAYNVCANEEIAYYRKLWFILTELEYNDSEYACDRLVTKDQLESIETNCTRILKSAYDTLVSDGTIYGLSFDDFVNHSLPEHISSKSDDLINSMINTADWNVTEKMKSFLMFCKKTLHDIDFTKDAILFSANW